MLKNQVKSIFIVSCCIGMLFLSSSYACADEVDQMRQKWAGFLSGQYSDGTDADVKAGIKSLNGEADYYWKRLNMDTSITSRIWNDLTYAYSKDITTSYRRLGIMALAYSCPNGKLFHDVALGTDIFRGMKWLYGHHYNENIPLPVPAGGSDVHNWWDYKIGTPLEINNIVILLYDEMAPAQRTQYMAAINHFTPDFTDAYTRKPALTQFTAANRVWVSTVIGLRGVILKDTAQIALAGRSLAPVFDYAETGDGFYRDGSFIQHVKHPYTGGYGISLLGRLSEEIYLLAKSPWAVQESDTEHIYRWIYDSFEPVVYKGNVMSMVEGREISRPDAEGNKKGALVTEAMALLSTVAPPDDAAKLRGIIQSWYGSTGLKSRFFVNMPPVYISLIKGLFKNNLPVTQPPAEFYKQFSHMDRAVQHAPGYAFGISMHSARIYNYETRTNYENIKGWHTSDGQTYLYNNDIDQFNDNFWATVNYYHLPGTTVEDQTEISGFKTSKKSWTGGVNFFNQYGTTGMDLAPAGQTLTAKKSWFMLNGQIVALGAGITNQDGADVNTYIDQRKLAEKDTSTFMIDGVLMPPTFGTDKGPSVRDHVQWAYLSGNAPGGAIGYYFPAGIKLNATRATQSGSWKNVNVNYSDKVYTRSYLTLWKNQGTENKDEHKSNNQYAYVLLPGFTAIQTKNYASAPDVTIIENTTRLQAVRSESLNLLAANFWDNTPTSINLSSIPEYLTCSTQAAVMVQKEKDTVRLAVSDPTMLRSDIIITVKEKLNRVVLQDPTIQVKQAGALTRILIHCANLGGKTVNLIFTTR